MRFKGTIIHFFQQQIFVSVTFTIFILIYYLNDEFRKHLREGVIYEMSILDEFEYIVTTRKNYNKIVYGLIWKYTQGVGTFSFC